ncbi:MAG TPA: PilZ domain-containing protein, partial [Chroococcales cyanobacterium]
VKKIPENRIALTLPDAETIIFLQRRKYVRVGTRLSCSVELKNADSYGAPINGDIYNISGGGCAMSLPSSIPVDRLVRIGFILNEEGKLSLMGRTLRSTIVPSPQGVAHRIGVEFDSPSDADRAKLVRYVYNVQRALLWKKKENA